MEKCFPGKEKYFVYLGIALHIEQFRKRTTFDHFPAFLGQRPLLAALEDIPFMDRFITSIHFTVAENLFSDTV